MTEENSPAELFAEWLRVRDEFDDLSAECGLVNQVPTIGDLPRPRHLDRETLQRLDQLERRQHELWDAYRGRLSL